MSAANDPHGYGRLHSFLLETEQALSACGNDREAGLVRQASFFYGGGSPSEFLGESRRALTAVLDSASGLPADVVIRIRAMIEEIDRGFRAVGGG